MADLGAPEHTARLSRTTPKPARTTAGAARSEKQMSEPTDSDIATKTLKGWQFDEVSLRDLAAHDCCSNFATGEWCDAGQMRHWHSFCKDLARYALAQSERAEKAEAALRRIKMEHQSYDDPANRSDNLSYATGVTDGHRCAAKIARAYFGEPTE